MTDVDPPEGRARDRDALSAVHEFKIANARPSIDKKEKLRLSSCSWPRAASWAVSCCTLVRRRADAEPRRESMVVVKQAQKSKEQ